MITEYPFEDRRYDQSQYEPFWALSDIALIRGRRRDRPSVPSYRDRHWPPQIVGRISLALADDRFQPS